MNLGRHHTLLLRLALCMALCLPGAASAEQVLRRGNGPDVESLDPHRVEGVAAADVMRDLFEGLVSTGLDAEPIPGVAERWEISEDGLHYRFFLRHDARWSNGDAVTAMDFVVALRRSVDPATGSNYSKILSPIRNADEIIEGEKPPDTLAVTAVDAHTLDIELTGPTPYLLGQLSHTSAYPVHRPSLAQWGADFAREGRLVSNGAYQLKRWALQSHIELVRNPHYWNNDKTRIDRVIFYTIEDLNAEYQRYRAGEIDWTTGVPITQLPQIKQRMPDDLRMHPYMGVYYYGMNLNRPPFKDNPKLRLALNMAIDRPLIAERILGDIDQAADGWMPPGVQNHHYARFAWADWPREQRLAKARQLYAEAGYSAARPARVEILYNTSDDHKKLATVVSAMWKQWLGVETVLRNQEWKVYLQSRRLQQDTEVFRAGWIGDYNDPNTFMEILHSQHGMNDVGYDSEVYDRLLHEASQESNLERRAWLMQAAEAQLLEDLPIIPLYFYNSKRLVRPTLKGWRGNVMDQHRSQTMYFDPATTGGAP